MNRRKALKMTGGIIAGGSIGLLTLANAFKMEELPEEKSNKLEYSPAESNWKYSTLDPDQTAELAYQQYSKGGCMYATVSSIVTQLAEKFGEPYVSIPLQMFKYGHGGVGGFGSVCGTLNGAAALIGMLIQDKKVQDALISDIFHWYEGKALPEYSPTNPKNDFIIPASISNSVLCHASNTNWCNKAGFAINSKERKERCRRLTSDVAKKLSAVLNDVFENSYVTIARKGETEKSCLVCHGKEGKLKNSSSGMDCKTCHTESVGHQFFADVHYKVME